MLQSPPLAELEGQYFRLVDGGIQLLDAGEPLNSERPPSSLFENEVLTEGFARLAEVGRNDGSVHVVLGNHGRRRHFRDMLIQHRKTFVAAQVVGIEASPAAVDFFGTGGIRRDAELDGEDRFHRAAIGWLGRRGKEILACDCEYGDALDQALTPAFTLYEELTADGRMDELTRNIARLVTLMNVHIRRQWAILGLFGFGLKQANKSKPEQVNAPLLILGEWHAPSAQRLENYFGIPVILHPTRYTNQTTEEQAEGRYAQTYLAIAGSGRVTRKQLKVGLPF